LEFVRASVSVFKLIYDRGPLLDVRSLAGLILVRGCGNRTLNSLFSRGAHLQRESRSVTPDPITRLSNGENVILGARRYVNLGMRYVFARIRTVPCGECLQPVRWWNPRVWLVDCARCAHLECFKRRLFLKALVADEIRRWQLMPEEIPPSPRLRSQSGDNGSPHNGLRHPDTSATGMRERVEPLEAQRQQAEELAARTHVVKNQRNGNSPVRELGHRLWHFLGRPVRHRPPLPPHLCMLCGKVAFSAMSVFCTKCGAPFRL
jgi:hypothetical protein